MSAFRWHVSLALLVLVATCTDVAAGSSTKVSFVDVAGPSGLKLVTVSGDPEKNYLVETIGSGVAVADFDGDGDEDLYIATTQTTADWLAGKKPRANALYRNEGDGTFVDVADKAGVGLRAWSGGVYFADTDGDGDKDLFVTTWGANVLYRNDGNGKFTDVTASAGLAGPDDGWSTSAAFGDLDGDGDLDLYVAQYCEFDLAHPPFDGERVVWRGISVLRGPRTLVAQRDLLYRNEGNGTFTDVTEASGVTAVAPSYGLGVVLADFDADGDLDIYVANDSRPNFLWRNEGGLRFLEVGARAGVATNEDAYPQAGMGTDAADYDDDGRPDLVVTNFSHDFNTLYRNLGKMLFVDFTFRGKLNGTYLSLGWGVKFFDYDNDGYLDILFANGHTYPEIEKLPSWNSTYRQANTLFRGLGDGTFQAYDKEAGPGLAVVAASRGLAVWDFERDGDLDVVITNVDGPPTLLRNDGGNGASWLILRLRGKSGHRDAIGARLELTIGGRSLHRVVNPFGSFLSQSTYDVHFGLGAVDRVDELVVYWPQGKPQRIKGLKARRVYLIEEGAEPVEVSKR